MNECRTCRHYLLPYSKEPCYSCNKRSNWEPRIDLIQASEAQDDTVSHPNHYTTGGIETLDFIKAKLTPEGFEGFLVGNILKYISRYRHKNGVEDLKKARYYLELLIKKLEAQKGD